MGPRSQIEPFYASRRIESLGERSTPVQLRPRPRLVDAGLLIGLFGALVTGVWGLIASPGDWWLFAIHGFAGLSLVGLLVWKLRRELPRLRDREWSPGIGLSLGLTVLACLALATGIGWTTGLLGGIWIGGWTMMVIHGGLGLLVAAVLLVHLLGRFRTPTREDWEGRRTSLQFLGLAVAGGLAWRVTQAVGTALDGADHRFTGSRAAGGVGTDFPVTSWVLDDPESIQPTDWQLTVTGHVDESLSLTYADLPDPESASETSAVLDCTSGWYADRTWHGISVRELLEQTRPTAQASWVTFHAVTGYRFGFPLSEIDDMLLATHVDGERLTHGHGFPLRVVAPGRRGFQWVKWVTAVEVREREDWGRWGAIFLSGL